MTTVKNIFLEKFVDKIYSCPYFFINYYKIKRQKLSKEIFLVCFGPRVGVVLQKQKHILLTKQYRFLMDDISLEIPGGKVEIGEGFENAAQRECLEETGINCSELTHLLSFYPGLDNVDNETRIFYCTNYADTNNFNSNDNEVIDTQWIHIDECLNYIRVGKILDSMTINAILAIKAFNL